MMHLLKFRFTFLLVMITFVNNTHAQVQDDEFDKCGYNTVWAKSHLQVLGDHWGYGYDSLLVDLEKWAVNPYIRIDSLGASVQNRAIWQLSITSQDTGDSEKQTVFIHARTHPGEIQSWWVTEQIIEQLTSESDLARLLRQTCVFYIIPMYNPDGVELEYLRQNANYVDLESNWDESPVQPEVAVLRARFSELMASPSPIKVAMNMHSAYGTHRYFVYHSSVGTSNQFAILEEDYIEGVRYYYYNGIEPWYYKITWTNGTPSYYPESWFWLNYQEDVMALTYEDWNDALAQNFDSTANAILNGIADYLDISPLNIVGSPTVISRFNLGQNYPNPFNPRTMINYQLTMSNDVQVTIYNSLGQEVAKLVSETQRAGRHEVLWDASSFSSGVYYCQIKTLEFVDTIKMVLMR